jgi:hypothetical protein
MKKYILFAILAIFTVLISGLLTFHLMDGPKKILIHKITPPPETEIKVYREFGELKAKQVPKKTRDQKIDDLLHRQSLENR